jgi:hypothetical protein
VLEHLRENLVQSPVLEGVVETQPSSFGGVAVALLVGNDSAADLGVVPAGFYPKQEDESNGSSVMAGQKLDGALIILDERREVVLADRCRCRRTLPNCRVVAVLVEERVVVRCDRPECEPVTPEKCRTWYTRLIRFGK